MHSVRTHKQIIGVVLAGGKSSRMGSNKALLPYKNRQLIDHMILLLKQMGLKKIIVSGEIEGYECISDSILQCGPMGGIYSVIHAMMNDCKNFLFVPVDMPLLTPEVLNNLLQNHQHHEAITFCEHPLPLMLNAGDNVKQILEKFFHYSASSFSIKYFLSLLNAKCIPIPEHISSTFININTPNDWRKMLKLDF